jgi:ribonucleotide monophosphatase NagD (HAD superfamily)
MHHLSVRYPVWFCDIWGVVHNGVTPFASTIDALTKHRKIGGTVILVSNSPRSSTGVERQLQEIGVARESHDTVVTSGDVTRTLVMNHGGGKVFHLGPQRDLSIFTGLDVARTGLKGAHAVLCTGLFDDSKETPGDYAALLADMKTLLYCAGSLAEAYAAIGGTVLMAGKPYRPIYDLAMQEAAKCRGAAIALDRILAIGDGPETDIRGAASYGIDALLVAEGVTDASAGLAAVEQAVKQAVPEARIVTTMRQLAWGE